jgi:hypothetical protein
MKRLFALLLFLQLPVCPPLQALELSDYVYANYLGSGIYTAAGRDVGVFALPFSAPEPVYQRDRLQVTVKIPVTLGFFDFSSGSPLPPGIPDQLGTLTVIPSVNFEYQVRQNWKLIPFVDLGFGKNFSDGSNVGIYATGIRSNYRFQIAGRESRLGNRLLYAAHTTATNPLTSFDTGIEINQPLNGKLFGKKLDVGIYAVNFLYLQNLQFVSFASGIPSANVAMQNEIGFTFGIGRGIERPTLKIPRFGLGYRVGDGVSAIRIVFGAPF